MSNCNDKKFENMLGAYQLGMLDPEDRDALELHLYECEYCFNKVHEFEQASLHLKHSPAVKKNIKQITESLPDIGKEKTSIFNVFLRKRIWPSYVPASVIVVVIFLFLILKPWRLEFQPQQEAEAASRLAIVDFRNLTDPQDTQRLGSIISNLLTTGLSEALPMKVVSNERLNDVLKMFGKTQKDVSDRETAANMAKRTGAKWILYGSLIDDNNKLTVTTQLTEAGSGEVKSGHRITAGPNENIFALADKLAVEIKKDLAFPTDSSSRTNRSIADITTHSPEAYRYYLEGVEYFQKFYNYEAIASFEKSLSYDSTLAMAWYYLARLQSGKGIEKALEYAKKSTLLQQLYISATANSLYGKNDTAVAIYQNIIRKFPDEKYAYYELSIKLYQTNKYDSTIQVLNEGIKVDPLFKSYYNQLAYTYNAIGNFDKALWAINKYIEISPNEANPYDSRGALYASNGMPDEAIESYRRALSIKPDFFPALEFMGHIYLLKGDYTRADSCYREMELKGQGTTRVLGRIYRALIPSCRGQIKATLAKLDTCLLLDKKEPVPGVASRVYYLKSFLYQGMDNFKLAIKLYNGAATAAFQANSNAFLPYHDIYVQMLAQDSQIDSALQVNKVIQAYNEQRGGNGNYHLYGLAAIASARNDLKTAIDNLTIMCANINEQQFFRFHYFLGRAYFALGDWPAVIKEYEAQLKIYDYEHIRHIIWHNSMHYYLGIAYEKSQMYDKAAQQYQTFLDIYKNADPDIPNLTDAAARLTKLKSKI
jgi:tetratricopeptide (TPR) repeat protein